MITIKAGVNIFPTTRGVWPCVSIIRQISAGRRLLKTFNQPMTPDDMPRAAGVPTMFRLPLQSSWDGLDACFLGIPMDNGTFTHRIGAR